MLAWFAWAAGAIYWLTFLPAVLRTLLATGYVVGFLILLRRAIRTQSAKKWLQHVAVSVVLVYLRTIVLRPYNERNWVTEHSRLAEVTRQGDEIQVQNFRHNVYRSAADFDVRFEDLQFRLSRLDKVWFVVQRFTALEGIAHNFLTFRWLADNGPEYFSVSVEVRREAGEAFSPVKGLYRQYELIYIIADERDEIGARTVLRPDDRVFLFPVNATAEQVQSLFLDITDRMGRLRDKPEFYHSLLNNCTNSIVEHTYKLTPEPINWLDPRIVAPGFADRFAYSNGLIGAEGESFESLRQRCRVDEVARNAGITESFSRDIRAATRPD